MFCGQGFFGCIIIVRVWALFVMINHVGYVYIHRSRCMIMQKMNRNNTSEAIRLPNKVVDFLNDLSSAKGISRHDLIREIVSTYIEAEKMRIALSAGA